MKVRSILGKEAYTLLGSVTNQTLSDTCIELYTLGHPCCPEAGYCLTLWEPQRDTDITIRPKIQEFRARKTGFQVLFGHNIPSSVQGRRSSWSWCSSLSITFREKQG